MAQRIRPTIGQLFALPLDSERIGYGQIVGFLVGSPYVVVFRSLYPRSASIDIRAIVSDAIDLMTGVMDRDLKNGVWPIVGRGPLAAGMFLPAFKSGVPGIARGEEIVSLDGIEARAAKPGETAQLEFPTIISPAGLEEAFRAIHGLGEWAPWRECLRYDLVKRESLATGLATRPLVEWRRRLREPRSRPPEQAVLVHIKLREHSLGNPAERERIRMLADEIDDKLRSTNLGDVDGDEVGGGECVLYIYGKSAEKVAKAIWPLLMNFGPPPGSFVYLRMGSHDDPAAREERVPIGSDASPRTQH